MNQEETLASLKKDVRTLLISSKIGLAPDQLRKDYVNMFGCPMPLKQLGFKNIMDMVKQVPDIVSLHFEADGSILLKGVGDESTRSIEKLVARQRCAKKCKKPASRCPNTYSSQFYQIPQVVLLPRRGRAPPSLPANLRSQLRILLSQGPIRLSDLETSYLRCYGQPLRVQSYGFFSTGEMLNAAADMIFIHQGRFGSVLSLRKHMLPRPVCTSYPPKRKLKLIEPGIPTEKSVFNVPCTNAEAQTNSPAKSPLNISNGSFTEKSWDPVMSESTCNRKPEQIEATALPQYEDIDLKQRIFKLDEELRQQIMENGVAGTISQELKNKLRQVVGQSMDGLSVHELPSAYQRLFGEDLPLVQSGFVSTTELVGAMNDIFHLKPSENDGRQDWTITDIQNNVAQIDVEESLDFNSGVKSEMRINYLISGESPWETQQESSVEDLDSSDNGDLSKNDELEINHIIQFKEEIPEKYNVIQVHCSSPAVPLDALQCQRLKPPTRRPPRELAMVLVEWVESPGHFYVRLSETEESRALENMMIHMRQCYKCPKLSERYRLPEQYIRQGQVCCVSPGGMWFYRVIIHQIITPTEVEVYYVDYGNMAAVKSANLKFLKSIYAALPAQAIPSSLAGIAPTTGKWTSAATASFQKLCCDRALVGALDCYVGDVLQLYLCNTQTDEDVYIHSVLLSQGHGLASSSAAEICAQVTPVSLYLGTKMVDLPEVQVQTPTSSFEPADALQSSVGSDSEDYEDDMPGLMLIDNHELIPQHPDHGSFNVLRNDKNFTFDELGSDLTCNSSFSSLTSVSFSPLAPPDLIQSETSPGHYNSDETQTPTPPPTPVILNSSSTCQTMTEVHDDPIATAIFKPPLILSMLNLFKPPMDQIQDCNQG
ncbi:tudor domain-containing protein 5 isoform X2 [Gouania willdenowi]|nr:tudor domain-containing protein 5 isoform X2 [Gouania willdenowi]